MVFCNETVYNASLEETHYSVHRYDHFDKQLQNISLILLFLFYENALIITYGGGGCFYRGEEGE